MNRILVFILSLSIFATAFGQTEDKSIPDLIKDLSSSKVDDRRDAAYELTKRGAAAKEAVPALTKAVNDDDEQVWFHSMQALARIGPDAGEAASSLSCSWVRREPQRRYRAAFALGSIGPTALPPVLQALGDSSSGVRAG